MAGDDFIVSGAVLSALMRSSEIGKNHVQARGRDYYIKSIFNAEVDEYVEDGWDIVRPFKFKTRIKKKKPISASFEDKVWSIIYRLGFKYINDYNFSIPINTSDPNSKLKKQIDVMACDDEVVLIIECKTKENRGKESLKDPLHETHSIQGEVIKSIHTSYRNCEDPQDMPKIVWIYATHNIIWSEPDIERAEKFNIKVLTEDDINYYESFIKHLGYAAKYQVLADLLKDKIIKGMKTQRVPAIRGKLGGHIYYLFSTTPRDLLKISFVNHNAYNLIDGRPAYQRMVESSRIKKIGNYIESGGYFPSNILVNFKVEPKFEPLPSKLHDSKSVRHGILTLPSTYRAAWIIDGQHRLYGYSKIPREYLDSEIIVVAFDNIDSVLEAHLFVTINHEQKSVAAGLLDTLARDLRNKSDDPRSRRRAIASEIVQFLNARNGCPFFRRFARHGIPAEPHQSLTISEVMKGLANTNLIGKIHKSKLISGPLSGGTSEGTIERATTVLSDYFTVIMEANPKRWDMGKAGYICVNPGIRAHLKLIRDLIDHITYRDGIDFDTLEASKFITHFSILISPLVKYLNEASDKTLDSKFSRKFGEGGVKEYYAHLCTIIQAEHADFGSDEFLTYKRETDEDRVNEANNIVIDISKEIVRIATDALKTKHGTKELKSGEQAYWAYGIKDDTIRREAHKSQQQDPPDKRMRIENYLTLLQWKKVIEQADLWPMVRPSFNIPMKDERKGKKYYTQWLIKLNEIRRVPSHPTPVRRYTDDDLEFLFWLQTEFHARITESNEE